MQTRKPPEKDPLPVEQLLQHDSSLHFISSKTEQIRLGNTILTQILDTPLRDHCFIASISEHLLTIATDSAVWATRLRYQQQTILSAFRANTSFKSLERIKTRVQPEKPTTQKKPSAKMVMSQHIGSLLQNSASIVKNPMLKKALLKLAKNGAVNHESNDTATTQREKL